MPEDDVGAILGAWGYRGTFALRSESLSVVTYATNDSLVPIPDREAETGSHQGFPRTHLHRGREGASGSWLRLEDRHLSVSR
jgi:hypothetical protein